MPPRRASSPQGVDEKEHWLRSGGPRSRPWVYEELLFGPSRDREQTRELGGLVEERYNERAELAGLYKELDAHFARIASLEKRLNELAPATERVEPRPAVSSTTVPNTRVVPAEKAESRASLVDRSYSLSRCEGFEVDSPTGPIGFVEGLRFISRIDQPDLLEVRGGRFGRQLVLIPIEQVEEVRVTDGRVVVGSAPTMTGDLLAELVDRFRKAVHFGQSAS